MKAHKLLVTLTFLILVAAPTAATAGVIPGTGIGLVLWSEQHPGDARTIAICLSVVALLIALLIALLALFEALATRHATVTTECRRGKDLDGVERDFWSFSCQHDNTLIGRTVGKAYITLAGWQFSWRQRRMQHNAGRTSNC